jgi:hypothetical protein
MAETLEAPAGSVAVDCVVFSKDRAMQLDACLRSIERHAPYEGPVTVVYRATSPAFAEGYRSLELAERVRLVAQGDFRDDVLRAIGGASDHVVFHTDDDVFFRAPRAAPVLPVGFAAFSLRLGLNTTHCYPLGRDQAVPPARPDGLLLAWDWARGDGDFAYPMSLDGHVLAKQLLRRMLRRARFSNPNELEAELHVRRHLAPRLMLAFRESCVVGIPANVVSETHRNRAGEDPGESPEALNERFLAGERIDLDAMDFSHVAGAHEPMPYVFAGSAPSLGPSSGERP